MPRSDAVAIGRPAFALRARVVDDDLALELIARGAPPLRWSYAGFTPLSLERPWRLVDARFAAPPRAMRRGRALVVRARTAEFAIEDRFAIERDELIVARRWRWLGAARDGVALGARLALIGAARANLTLPHVLYHGNPSADPARLVPRFPADGDTAVVVEEHRLPIPAIDAEWAAGARRSCTLAAAPAPISRADDHWWSLGARRVGDAMELLALSGVVALNGERDAIYDGQNRSGPLPGGGYWRARRGATLAKTLRIAYAPCAPGRGFVGLVRRGWRALRPRARATMPLARYVALKANALRSRWTRLGAYEGFARLPATAAEGNVYGASQAFHFGWTGQALRLAWCAAEVGRRARDPRWAAMAERTLDCWSDAPETDAPGLPMLYYGADGAWYRGQDRDEVVSARMLGESLANACDCLLALGRARRPLAARWLETVRRRLAFLRRPESLTADGVFPLAYRGAAPDRDIVAAGGAPCVLAMLAAAELLGDDGARRAACRVLAAYERRFARDFATPFARSTLDAACEDKEAGVYVLLAAHRAWRLGGDARHAALARLCAEWIATFVYAWDPGMRPGTRCARERFRCVGWPGVSVQNVHLDVFFPCFEVVDLGRRLRDPFLVGLGTAAMRALSHGVARRPGHWDLRTPGEQGEQFYHTNFGFLPHRRGPVWRGGYNAWNPAWIIALPLQSALRLAEVPGFARRYASASG